MTERARRPGIADAARTLGALLAIPAGLGVGVVHYAVTRDRRRARNRTYAAWIRLGLAAAGIRLAVSGGEHLERARPAVFLINHQSGIDPLLVCALLRRDFVGVAKAELRRNPLLGPALAFAGTVFLDRFDRTRAIAQLEPGLEALRGGLSIAVAPEGTRSAGTRPGRFKKGAFRLALAAGVPIVPIVIHNAADVLPRRAWLMTPATVSVEVLAPRATAGWRLDELEARIAEVGSLYASRLGY